MTWWCPSNQFIETQIKAGVFQKLDKTKLPNWKHQDPALLKLLDKNDPGNQYGVPYMYGTVLIGFNPAKVKAALGENAPVDSWDLVFKPENMEKLKACGVAMLDSPSEILPLALHYLGLDPNSQNPEDYEKAKALMLKIRPYVTYFNSAKYMTDIANGDICVAIGYSGSFYQFGNRAKEAGNGVVVDWRLPKEGAPIWFDTFAIPKSAKNVDEAHAFLNTLLDPTVIAPISDFLGYPNANKDSLALINKEITGNTNLTPTPRPSKPCTSCSRCRRSWSGCARGCGRPSSRTNNPQSCRREQAAGRRCTWRVPRGVRCPASSLTTIASMLAPTGFGGADKVVAQFHDRLLHLHEIVGIQAGLRKAVFRQLCAQLATGVGQADSYLAFVFRVALTQQVTHRFELFQDRGEGVGFQEQFFPEAADGLVVLLPQRNEGDVLRIGQAESFEHRLVGLAESEVGGIDRKTQEIGKLEIAGRTSCRWFSWVLSCGQAATLELYVVCDGVGSALNLRVPPPKRPVTGDNPGEPAVRCSRGLDVDAHVDVAAGGLGVRADRIGVVRQFASRLHVTGLAPAGSIGPGGSRLRRSGPDRLRCPRPCRPAMSTFACWAARPTAAM